MLEQHAYSHLKQQEQDLSLHLILYSKPGCHLCEGLQEKLVQIQSLDLALDVRDITTRDDWFQAYQYEIPVLVLVGSEGRGKAEEEAGAGEAIQSSTLHPSSFIPLPRPSPRATVQQLEKMLRQYL
ncbi:glutaredoxin family protein [Leptolyngbya sp. FACHB-321]|uniref:glutaredoxin family protein n=1 Tax=Leptolyngbya sp. FACHB-321 TaxID=2692807 RepID=UPI001F54C705|nr:glutaredoxin family protein [Leptolyngbya sp. FACHB-321]